MAKPPTDPKPQADKFRDLARELECDEDEDAFKAKLREIAKTPPQHREKPPSGSE
jgi:hypothetical protein